MEIQNSHLDSLQEFPKLKALIIYVISKISNRPYGTIMEGVKVGGLLIKDIEFLALIL